MGNWMVGGYGAQASVEPLDALRLSPCIILGADEGVLRVAGRLRVRVVELDTNG